MADVKMTFLLVVLLWRSFNYGEAQTCEGSKAAYAASGFSMDDVPENPVQGTFSQLCEQSLETCCTSTMESNFENTTKSSIIPLIPPLNTFTSKAEELILPAEDQITDNLSAVVEYWKTAVVSLDTTTQNAFQSLQSDLKAIVDDNVAGQVAASVSRLLTVLRLTLVSTPSTSYTEEFLTCAQSALTLGGYLPNTTQLLTRLTSVLRARFHMREIITRLENVFVTLAGLPVRECVRSYAQLFYCHICDHNVAGASPCDVVCENVLAGCAGHLHLLGAAIDTAETVATNLYNVGNINSLWDFRQIATRMREVIVQTQTATTTELGRIVNDLNQCQGAPTLVTPASDIPQPVTTGTLNSAVPTSLFNHMYEPIFQGLKATVFDKFDDISETFVTERCGSTVDSGACWSRTELVLRTPETSVDFGADALNNNPDIIVDGRDREIQDLRGTFIPRLGDLNSQLNNATSFVADLPDELTSAVYKIQPAYPLVLVSIVIAMNVWMR